MGIHAQFALLNRRAIADEIERLIAILDAADAPLEDLEPDDSEADFVWYDPHRRVWIGEEVGREEGCR